MWAHGLGRGLREAAKLLKRTVLGNLTKGTRGLYVGKQSPISIKFLSLITILRLLKRMSLRRKMGGCQGWGEGDGSSYFMVKEFCLRRMEMF